MKHNLVTFLLITTVTLSGIVFWETGYVWGVIFTQMAVYLLITAYGSYAIRANYFLKSINKGRKKSVALTFDDGPDPRRTPLILEILKAKNVKATFFVIGKNAVKYPDLLRQIDEDGHTVANHSYSHHYLIAFFSTARLSNDLARCNEIIFDIIGKKPLFFRPPFGVTNPRYAKALADNQLLSIGWSLRSLDTGTKTKYRLIERIISNLKRGDIILLHDPAPVTADALGDIIEHIFSKKMDIGLLSKVIIKEPYAKV